MLAKSTASPNWYLSCKVFVIAAVNVVLPWSTWPIVPILTCGLVLSNLAFRSDLTDDERALRAELRIELKNASNDLAKELKQEFDEIERQRKKLKWLK